MINVFDMIDTPADRKRLVRILIPLAIAEALLICFAITVVVLRYTT